MDPLFNIVINECFAGIFQQTEFFANILISHLFPKFIEFFRKTFPVDGYYTHFFTDNSACQV